MLRSKPKSLSELISRADTPLSQLAQEARRRTDLSDFLRKKLPPELAAGLTHCNFHADGTLMLLASSPERAARLRFEAEQVRQLCMEHGTNVTQIKVRVSIDPGR